MGKYSDHSTYMNKLDVEVPSVTTILKVLNKPSIAKWANSLGWKRMSYEKVLEERAFEGTIVHELCHEVLFKEGAKFDTSTPERLEFISSYLKNFNSFLDEHKLEPIWGEKSFSSDRFGGTVDLYCVLDGKKTILDFKTSKSFYSTHFIQLGAYIQLLEQEDLSVEQVAILRLRDGKRAIKIISREDMEKYIEIFNKLCDLFYLIYDLNEEWKDLM